jgi:hypothetical protein
MVQQQPIIDLDADEPWPTQVPIEKHVFERRRLHPGGREWWVRIQ